jgi:hypothetical protein
VQWTNSHHGGFALSSDTLALAVPISVRLTTVLFLCSLLSRLIPQKKGRTTSLFLIKKFDNKIASPPKYIGHLSFDEVSQSIIGGQKRGGRGDV